MYLFSILYILTPEKKLKNRGKSLFKIKLFVKDHFSQCNGTDYPTKSSIKLFHTLYHDLKKV